jgi:hypothetical protein
LRNDNDEDDDDDDEESSEDVQEPEEEPLDLNDPDVIRMLQGGLRVRKRVKYNAGTRPRRPFSGVAYAADTLHAQSTLLLYLIVAGTSCRHRCRS